MTGSNDKKGIGIIGYGGFGELLRKSWDVMNSVEIVAVCDSDPVRAPVDLKFYQQIGPLLADPDVDIVSIATPPNSHLDIALMSLEAGKHTLIEKPLALSEEDALKIKMTAESTQRVASVDFMLRYNRIVEMVGDIIKAEVLGKLRRIDLRNYAMLDQTPESHWFWKPSISGRILLEHGVHFFDLAHFYTNSLARDVIAMSEKRKPEIEDEMFAAVRYENGIIGTFWHSFSRPRLLETTTYHLAFDLGEIDVFGWIPLEMRLWGWTDNKGLQFLSDLHPGMDIQAEKIGPMRTQSSNQFYDVEHSIQARVELSRPKIEVYSENLRAIMDDMVHAIDDPKHKMRVTLDDGIESVRVAEMATRFIHPEERPVTARTEPEVMRP
jgi:predicted dehydrogenase